MEINKTFWGNPQTSKMKQIKGIILHNTAGGDSAKTFAEWSLNNLINKNTTRGFVPFWVDDKEIYQICDETFVAWHSGSNANNFTIGIEIVDGLPIDRFEQAEKKAFQLAAFLADKYGLPKNCISLHRDYAATACPKKSADLHGGYDAVRAYFNAEVDKLRTAQPKNDIIKTSGNALVLVNKLNVRSEPSAASQSVATYSKNDTFKYDGYIDAGGYRWLTYIGGSGIRRYVAEKTLNDSQLFVKIWKWKRG